ncbi:MAG: hypothetical protein SFY80_05890 [Verrucomicrobiota bacterium]|nr:hypothetical protein [Verrucomicrobiota bacterium]
MRLFPAFISLLVTATTLLAVRTDSFVDEGWSAFNMAELKDLALTADGLLTPAPQLELVKKLDVAVVWSAEVAPDGTLYLGTGNDGEVLRLTPTGTLSTIFQPGEVMSRALALDKEGRLYVGTSPGGKVYRILKDGRAELFFSSGDTYIWAMTFDKDGYLYVGAGSPAKIYRLPASNEPIMNAKPWFTSSEDHVTTLAWARSGNLLAGTAPTGILYSINKSGQAFALFSSGSQEIRSITTTAEGTVYFSTFNADAPGGGKSVRSAGNKPGESQPNSSGRDEEGDEAPANKPKTDGPPSQPNPKAPNNAPRSEIYRLDSDGFSEVVGVSRRAGLFAIHSLGKGEWLAGSEDSGKIYRGVDRMNWMQLQQCENGGEVSLFVPPPANDGSLYVLTSNPSAIYKLNAKQAESGSLVSKPFDAGQQVTWGKMDLVGERSPFPAAVRVRSGNTPTPDKTWTEWVATTLQQGGLAADLPATRYFQYEVSFKSSTQSGLRRVRVHYQLPNATPQFAMLRVLPIGLERISIDPNQPPQIDMERFLRAPGIQNLFGDPQLRPQLRRIPDNGYFTAAWKAYDPNDDELTFDISLRSSGKSDWLILATGYPESIFTYNTKGLADGFYQLKVTVSDSPSNRPDSERSTEKVSELFLVDNTPPRLTVVEKVLKGPKPYVVVAVTDDWSVITDGRFSIDGSPFSIILPDDDLYDSRAERITLFLEGIDSGDHSLVFEFAEEGGRSAILTLPLKVEE